jgi:ubiquinone/menaquinone biosynthesis C-methylase UbiE
MVEKKSDDVEYFNCRSLTYEASLEQWFFFDRFQKAVLNMVEKEYTPEVVLDVGCVTGEVAAQSQGTLANGWVDRCGCRSRYDRERALKLVQSESEALRIAFLQ